MANYLRTLLRHRAVASAALLVTIVIAAYSATSIRILFQFRDFFSYPGARGAELYEQDNRDFGDPAGHVIVMVEADDVFRPDLFEYLVRVTERIQRSTQLFKRVRTLANVSVVRGKGDEVISGPLISGLPALPKELEDAKRYALRSPLLLHRLVSSDGTATAILAEMRTPATLATVGEQRDAIAAVQKAIAAQDLPPGVRARVTGAPTVEVTNTTTLLHDQLLLIPAVVVVLMCVLLVMFRSLHGIVLSMGALGTAMVWTAGIFPLFGRPVDVVGSVIPITILSYGAVDPVFVLMRFARKLRAGSTKDSALIEAFTELSMPCCLSSVTTAVAFAAFFAARAPTMRYYGLTVAIGVILAWVTTFTVLPLLLSYAPLPRRRFEDLKLNHEVDRWVRSAWRRLSSHRGVTIALACTTLAVCGLVARKQSLNNVYVAGLPSGVVRTNVEALESKISGVMRLVIRLEGPRDSMKAVGTLQALSRIEQRLRSSPLVTSATSIADLLAEVNQAFAGGGEGDRVVPVSRTLIAQYLSLINPGDRADLVSDDYSRARVAILMRDSGSEKTRALVRSVQRWVDDANFSKLGIKAQLTGLAVVGYNEFDNMVLELLEGFALSFFLILFVEAIVLRSLRISLVTALPNLLPVVACFAILGVAHIDLRIDSAMVVCISIGGLFNNTIHLASRVLQQLRAGRRDPDEMIEEALSAVGPPAFVTAVTLSAGFSVLLLSSFPGLRLLGALSTFTLMLGFASDMIVTPVLLRSGINWRKRLQSNPTALAPCVSERRLT